MDIPNLPAGFRVEVLTEETAEEGRRLCDKHVGVGLYEPSFFKTLPRLENHRFVLVAHGDRYIGYFYCRLIQTLSEMPDLENAAVRSMIPQGEPIGVCRSIGIDVEYRGSGLSDILLRFFSEYLFTQNCGIVLVPAWKKKEKIPARRHLEASGFHHLCNLREPWKENARLRCPFCRNTPCICDAAIYYKLEE